jgi:hypothetical protein
MILKVRFIQTLFTAILLGIVYFDTPLKQSTIMKLVFKLKFNLTVKPRYNAPRYNAILDITRKIFGPGKIVF